MPMVFSDGIFSWNFRRVSPFLIHFCVAAGAGLGRLAAAERGRLGISTVLHGVSGSPGTALPTALHGAWEVVPLIPVYLGGYSML